MMHPPFDFTLAHFRVGVHRWRNTQETRSFSGRAARAGALELFEVADGGVEVALGGGREGAALGFEAVELAVGSLGGGVVRDLAGVGEEVAVGEAEEVVERTR